MLQAVHDAAREHRDSFFVRAAADDDPRLSHRPPVFRHMVRRMAADVDAGFGHYFDGLRIDAGRRFSSRRKDIKRESNDCMKPWAIWLRQLLPVHKISILIVYAFFQPIRAVWFPGKSFDAFDPRQFTLRFGLQERIVRGHQRQAEGFHPPLIAYSGYGARSACNRSASNTGVASGSVTITTSVCPGSRRRGSRCATAP